MPVASYMDTDILCLMRLIGMCILDKHIRSQAAYLREAQYILRKQVQNTVDTSNECQLRTILLLVKVQYLVHRSVWSNINTTHTYRPHDHKCCRNSAASWLSSGRGAIRDVFFLPTSKNDHYISHKYLSFFKFICILAKIDQLARWLTCNVKVASWVPPLMLCQFDILVIIYCMWTCPEMCLSISYRLIRVPLWDGSFC